MIIELTTWSAYWPSSRVKCAWKPYAALVDSCKWHNNKPAYAYNGFMMKYKENLIRLKLAIEDAWICDIIC
jgi:hypothetical protein